MQEYGIYFNAATLLALVVAIAGGVRKFSRIETLVESEKESREMMEAQIENNTRDIRVVERENSQRLDVMRQETGEMGAALRQKIHEVEMSSRDRIDEMAADIRESIEKLGDRLEGKIDRAMQRRD